MVREINWTVRARNDLHDIYAFIAKDSCRYAQTQIETIQNTVSNLTSFPLMGHKVPEFSNLPYREILVGNYRILYRFEEEPNRILIMAVAHGRRLLKELP